MKKITRTAMNTFLKKHASSARTLDVGSGGAHFSVYFPDRVTVDIDPARGPDIIGDIHALPFPDASFEHVICMEVLEHVADPRVAISELKRVLKPGGKLIFSTRCAFPLHDTPHDLWRFTEYGLRRLFSEWEIEELIPETGSLSAVAALLQRLEFQIRFKANVLVKAALRVLTLVLMHADFLIEHEYGDIGRTQNAKNILTTGYYLVLRKRA